MAKTNETKKDNLEATTVAQDNVTEKMSKNDTWNVGRLFWGLLLIAIGGLLLADNFGYVEVNWGNLWQLWPLLIIAAGLSVLSLRTLFWRILSVVLVVAALVGAVFVTVGNYPDPRPSLVRETTTQKSSDLVKQATVSIKAGASELRVNTSNQSEIVKAKLQSNMASLSEVSRRNGDTQQVELSMTSNQHWWVGNMRSTLNIDLTRRLPLSLHIDAGASDTIVDVSEAQLNDVTVNAGASSFSLKLGERQDTTRVTIDAGASSIVIRIPADSGVQMKLDGGLSSKNLADLVEVSEGRYESPNYSQANKKIIIDGNVGVSSFTIERY